MKVWRNLLIGAVVFACLWTGLNYYLSSEIKKHYNKNIYNDYGVISKDQGVILQQTALDKGDLLLFGSSELASTVDQKTTRFFPTKEFPYSVCSIGRAGVLSMEDSLNIESLHFTPDSKVVFLVSLGWFTDYSIVPDAFYANFSKNKFYRYMSDWSIPDQEKIDTAARVSDLIGTYTDTEDLDAWAIGKISRKIPIAFKAANVLTYPWMMFVQAVLNTKDLAASLDYLDKQSAQEQKPLAATDWNKEYLNADVQGGKAVSDSDFYFEDSYRSQIEEILPGQKNSSAGVDLTNSLELRDYDTFLKTCKRKHIKPLIIVESVNGWYFDYKGLGKDKRIAMYSKLCSMANEYGFEAYDMSALEYTPYAYSDEWHLGWRGWLYVNQKITGYFGQNR